MKGILMKYPLRLETAKGNKTNTRRLITLPKWAVPGTLEIDSDGMACASRRETCCMPMVRPQYGVGDIVYLREQLYKERVHGIEKRPVAVAKYHDDDFCVIRNEGGNYLWRWKNDWLSPIHCPADAARHFIRITEVRAEHLQDITREDAWAEGITDHAKEFYGRDVIEQEDDFWRNRSAVENFAFLWNTIHKVQTWETNPIVYVYVYKYIQKETLPAIELEIEGSN